MFIHFPVRYVNVDQGLNIMQLKSCFHLIFHGAFGGNFRSVLAKRQQSAGWWAFICRTCWTKELEIAGVEWEIPGISWEKQKDLKNKVIYTYNWLDLWKMMGKIWWNWQLIIWYQYDHHFVEATCADHHPSSSELGQWDLWDCTNRSSAGKLEEELVFAGKSPKKHLHKFINRYK